MVLKSLLLSPHIKEQSASRLTAAETMPVAGCKKKEMSGKSLFFFFRYGL
jgi:hypothetical protein